MKNLNKFILSLALLCTIFGSRILAADLPQYGTPFAGVPDTRDVNIYQVSVGQYSASRNFQGVIAGLDNIKALGINVIYLMPTYPVGVSGSPYSITDFGGVNPDFGTLTDLRALVDAAHAKGMAVILDWVGYETAADHPWVTSHPDWFKKDGGGAIVHPFPDCSALITTNPTVANTMIQYMRDWIFTANIDGFRCDWADYSEPAYWTSVISNLRSITTHKLLMLAEGSNEGASSGCTTCGNNEPGYHYAQGFDFIFGESFYWNVMKKCYLNGESAKNLEGVTTGEYIGASSTQFVARYMSNHDEYGSDGSPYTLLGGKAQVLNAFVIATYFRGVPFIYNGVEVGNTSPLPYPWNTGTINWTQDLTVLAEFKKIMAFRVASDAIRRGTPTSYSSVDVAAFTKTSGTQTAFVAANMRNASKTYTLPVGVAGTTMYDAFTNAPVTFGTTITLSAYQYVVYINSVVNVVSVSVNPTTATIAGTATQQLSASVLPADATNKNVTWASGNTAVATVNATTGLVTGVSPGSATITATSVDQGKTATCAITVTNVAVTGVTVIPTAATIFIGGAKAQLTATVAPATANNKNINWTSDNTAVATVNVTSGLVTSVAVGTTVITATTVDGSKIATATITVEATPQFTVYFQKPANWGTGVNVYFWSALPAGSIADASWPGASMPLANGWYSQTFTKATSINIIFNDGTSQTVNLTRDKDGWYANDVWYDSKPAASTVTGVTITPTTSALYIGSSKQLAATVAPANATDISASWSSSNTAIATVNPTNGVVSGVAAGIATITVKTTDGNKTATCEVIVSQAPADAPFKIANRWKPDMYIFDASAKANYGASTSNTDLAYQWTLEDAGSGFVAIKNLASGKYLEIENLQDYVECTATDMAWYSSHWTKTTNIDGYVTFSNRWKTDNIMNIENLKGYAQHSSIQADWHSAQWLLEPVVPTNLANNLKQENTIYTVNNIIYFNVSDKSSTISVALYNINGQVVLTVDNVANNSLKLNVLAGIYVARIQIGSQLLVKKVVVR